MFKKELDTPNRQVGNKTMRRTKKKQQSRHVGGWCVGVTSNIVWFYSFDDKAPGSQSRVIQTESRNCLFDTSIKFNPAKLCKEITTILSLCEQKESKNPVDKLYKKNTHEHVWIKFFIDAILNNYNMICFLLLIPFTFTCVQLNSSSCLKMTKN